MRQRCVLLLALLVTLPATSARAQDPAPLPAARRSATPAGASRSISFTPALPRLPLRGITNEELFVSAALSAGLLALSLAPWPNAQTGWQSGNLLDDSVRGSMVLPDAGRRQMASLASDVLVSGLTLMPVLFDTAILAWALRGDPALAARMLLIDLQAFAIAQGITAIAKHAAGRERPWARGCREDPARRADDPSCQGSADPGATESFFSGHASLAFTSAALICLHHTELGLVGEAGDAAMCVTGLALAGTVGVLRILSDRHYAADVLIGAGVGLLSGWLVPWLLHYDIADEVTNGRVHGTIAPMVDGDRFGAQIFGTF